MTDAPKPTQEEQDRALWYARMLAPTPADNENHNLARCHIHATAELARAEERIRLLRTAMEPIAAIRTGQWSPRTRVLMALDQDDKLARGESEETEMEPKFTPKPGDRVRLTACPTFPGLVGRTFRILDPDAEAWRDEQTCAMEDPRTTGTVWSFSDAVFATAPAQAESTDDGLTTCPRHGRCNPRDCMFATPYCLEAEQPPAVAPGVAAGEVTDEAAVMACMSWMEAYGKDNDGKLPHIAEAFYAGRASVLAERSEMERRVEDLAKRVMPGAETLAASLEASQAEVAELKRELHEAEVRLDGYSSMCAEAEQALEAEKVAHDSLRQERDHYVHEASRLGRELLAAQKARAVPSRGQIADAIHVLTTTTQQSGEGWFAKYLRAADYVLALCASPPASPDNTPPKRERPIHPSRRMGQEYKQANERIAADLAECAKYDDNTPPTVIENNGPINEVETDRARLEAEGWNEERNACWCSDRASGGIPCPIGKCPNAPSPDAGIEAVKAEVAELRLQGRVTRRLVVELADDGASPRWQKHFADALARIEREEREAAGKAP